MPSAGRTADQLDLVKAGPLTFYEPDTDLFRALPLAIQAGKTGGTLPCTFNAANEVAVAAFLQGKISFLKNIIGLWLIQESRRQWIREGKEYSFGHLEQMAADAKPFKALIDPRKPLCSRNNRRICIVDHLSGHCLVWRTDHGP